MFKFLATGTMTLFIAACYGVMMQWKRIIAHDPEGAGIGGLQVTLLDARNEQTFTDPYGVAEFTRFAPLEGLTVTIEDVDGLENGGQFASEWLIFGTMDEYVITMTRL
jgi:hypothetical protein